LGALDDSSSSEGVAIHQSEEQRLLVESASRRMQTIAEQRESDSSHSPPGREIPSFASTRSSRRKSSKPKIQEGEEFSSGFDVEITAAMQAIMHIETEIDACLDRDSMLERLSDLDIIEEVHEWVSVDVKRRISWQRLLPVMPRYVSNNPIPGIPRISAPAGRIASPLIEEKSGDNNEDDDDEHMPPPPGFVFRHQTV
jgi:hypothetical protein